ncbi:MAG: HEAT repeat domain-containing protein [Phycisphaerae bacterium]
MLTQLKQIRLQGSSPATLAALQKALGSGVSLLVAKAAEIAAEFEAQPLSDALDGAFARFMKNPLRSDKGCQAKTAVVDALYRIGACSADVYLRGIGHVQMEPSYGGPVDTAAKLRGLCALGLARMNHPETMNELARLLADPEPDARIMAARALAYAGDARGEPLLRYKAHLGDNDSQVLAECFLALLRLSPQTSLDFVAAYLESGHADQVEAAAMALGESRMPQALPPLQTAYGRTADGDTGQALLIAIASLRSDSAVDFLLEQLKDARRQTAEAVLAALATFRHDQAIRVRVCDSVDQRHDRQLTEAFRACFGV